MPEPHEATVRTDHRGRYWLTCTCGWKADPVTPGPEGWEEWRALLWAHVADRATTEEAS